MNQKATQRPRTENDDATRHESQARLRIAEPKPKAESRSVSDPIENGYNLPFTD